MLTSVKLRAVVVKYSIHSLHQVVFDIMKGHTLCSTVVNAPLHVDRIVRVPVILFVQRWSICEMVCWLKGHITLSSSFILGVIRNNTILSETVRNHTIFTECMHIREAIWQVENQCFQRCLIHCISRTARNEHAFPIALLSEPSSHKEWDLCIL